MASHGFMLGRLDEAEKALTKASKALDRVKLGDDLTEKRLDAVDGWVGEIVDKAQQAVKQAKDLQGQVQKLKGTE